MQHTCCRETGASACVAQWGMQLVLVLCSRCGCCWCLNDLPQLFGGTRRASTKVNQHMHCGEACYKIQHPALQSSLLRNNEKAQKGRAAIYLDSVILSYIQLSGRSSVLSISAWISHINVEILSHQIMAVYAIHQKYLLLMLFIPVLGQPWHAVTVTTTAMVMLLRCLSGTQ